MTSTFFKSIAVFFSHGNGICDDHFPAIGGGHNWKNGSVYKDCFPFGAALNDSSGFKQLLSI